MPDLWKSNWDETRAHFRQWWAGEGLVLGSWGTGLPATHRHEIVPEPVAPMSMRERHTDAEYVARYVRFKMSQRCWPADILPTAWPHIGTLPLAACLGAAAEYAQHHVWYHPCMSDIDTHPTLVFDPENPEVRQLQAILRRTVELSKGNYFVAMPALLGGIDVLAELRGTSDMLLDMLDNPAAVHRRLREIQDAYVRAFERMYEIIKLPDGSMCFGYFMLWGEGRTGLCQCDTATMISPGMFREFVVPYLREQCAFLDFSMYHVDGSQALLHLDKVLAVDELDAVEFTPEPGAPGAADPLWFETYRQILQAGKSVWVANLQKHEVLPVLDAIGTRGVYVSVNNITETDAEDLIRGIEPRRG